MAVTNRTIQYNFKSINFPIYIIVVNIILYGRFTYSFWVDWSPNSLVFVVIVGWWPRIYDATRFVARIIVAETWFTIRLPPYYHNRTHEIVFHHRKRAHWTERFHTSNHNTHIGITTRETSHAYLTSIMVNAIYSIGWQTQFCIIFRFNNLLDFIVDYFSCTRDKHGNGCGSQALAADVCALISII